MKKFLLAWSLFLTLSASAQIYTDNFSGSGTVTTPPWTNSGYGVIGVRDGSGNVWGNGSTMAMYYSGGTFSNTNLYSQIKIIATSTNTFGPCLWTPGVGGTCWLINANVAYDVGPTGAGLGGLGSCPAVSVGDTVRFSFTGGSYHCTNLTTNADAHYPPLNFSTASFPAMELDNPAKATNFQAGPADTAMSLSPNILINGATNKTITLFGTNTHWLSLSATFSLSGGSGASILSQHVNSDTSATLVVNAGTLDGLLTVQDSTTLNTATIKVHTPSTLYVRVDGGTRSQCTGKVNAAYSVGVAPNCAIAHPSYALDPSLPGLQWDSNMYSGGDTMQYVDSATSNPGLYYIGTKGSSGLGLDMPALGFSFCVANNFNCKWPPLPSGDSTHPTRMLGPCAAVSAANCLNGKVGLTDAATLSAVNGVFWMLNTQGSAYFEVAGLIFTQPTQCVGNDQSRTGTCTTGNDYAANAIDMAEDSTGNVGPLNGTFHYLDIHGISKEAFHGSSWNMTGACPQVGTGCPAADTMTFDHIFMRGIGYTGFDPDNGNCHSTPGPCESVGTIVFTNWIVNFIGCVTPSSVTFDPTTGLPNNVNYCYAQQTGGQGDCMVLIAMGTPANVLYQNNDIRYCTQDAHDLLHIGDNFVAGQTLKIYNDIAIGAMGQQYKVGGGAVFTVQNNFANGNCDVMTLGTAAVFSGFTAGWNAGLQDPSDRCRAGGDIWAVFVADGRTLNMAHNTTVGYGGGTTYDVQCSATCTTTDDFIFQDNITMGYVSPISSNLPSGMSFIGVSNPFANAGSAIDHNQWFNMLSGVCQQVSQETNFLCTDPLFTSESNVDTVVWSLQNTSPAKWSGAVPTGTNILLTDQVGGLWNNPTPSRGALEIVNAVVKKILKKVHH